MQVSVEEVSSTRRKLSIEVPEDEVSRELDRAYDRLRGQAKIKGFRPGKAPRRILEQYFGERVRSDVLAHLIEHSYSDALEETGLEPVDSPEIVPESVEQGKPLRYSATVDIQPPIEITDYEGIEAERVVHEVGDKDVDEAVERIRESLAQIVPVEDREEVQSGDLVLVDTKMSIDGEELEGRTREGELVEVGTGSLPEQMDAAVVGLKIGETAAPEIPFPEDHPNPELAGKSAVLEFTIRGIRAKQMPEANDDLAAEHGEFSTLEELRADIRRRIEDSAKESSEEALRQQIVEKLIEQNDFDVPEAITDRQTQGMLDSFLQRFGAEAESIRADADRLDELRREIRPRAETQVRGALALEALAKAQSLTVEESDLDAKIQEMTASMGANGERVAQAYRSGQNREELRSRLRRERALDVVIAAAKIKDVPPPPPPAED